MSKIRYLLSVAETIKTQAKTLVWYPVEVTQYYSVLKIKAKFT